MKRPVAAAEELAAFDPRLKLRTDCLVRTLDIPRLASGGERTVATHLRSIVVTSDVAGATVLVLDDVVTTGQSIEAVRQLLEEAGAARVGAVALARTMRYHGLAA